MVQSFSGQQSPCQAYYKVRGGDDIFKNEITPLVTITEHPTPRLLAEMNSGFEKLK